MVYTGGDDCAFKGWDLRDSGAAVFEKRREHQAGVCCIAPSFMHEHLVVTGSYDDHARVWDTRNSCTPVCKHKVRAA